MGGHRHISWENFALNYINPSVPARHTIPGIPGVQFFVTDKSTRIGIQIETETIEDIKYDLEQVESSIQRLDDKLYLEISTTNSSLFEPFYALMVKISDLVQISEFQPNEAAIAAIEEFRRLLEKKPLLSREKELGLWGELWVLDRLIKKRGPAAVMAWTGPLKKVHDFRLDNLELEVKTTSNEERSHIISRIAQLECSPGKKLFLLSLQVQEGGLNRGLTLSEVIESTKKLLLASAKMKRHFESLTKEVGYLDEDAKYYNTRVAMRRIPTLIPVNSDCPKLTQIMITGSIGDQLAARISGVHYRIDVEGLGFEEGSKQFNSILG